MEKVPDSGRTGSHGTRVTKMGDYKRMWVLVTGKRCPSTSQSSF